MIPFPKTSLSRTEVLAQMREARRGDARWKEGRTFSLVYHAGDEIALLLADVDHVRGAELRVHLLGETLHGRPVGDVDVIRGGSTCQLGGVLGSRGVALLGMPGEPLERRAKVLEVGL